MAVLTSIIINADDFGMSTDVNRAILAAFQQGLCSSTTLLTNLPGFEEACESAHQHQITSRIGLHLNLGEGSPLTDGIKRSKTFCNSSGQFAVSSKHVLFHLTHSESQLLAAEVRAQIAICRKNGIPLSHADSHRHLHVQWPILSVLLRVARDEQIPYVRLPRNCGSGISWYKRVYKDAVIGRIRKAGMCRTDYFGGVSDYLWLKSAKRPAGSMEVMVHPRYVGNELSDYLGQFPLRPQVENIDSYAVATPFVRELKQ